jgi:type I restriction enzyme S subunit
MTWKTTPIGTVIRTSQYGLSLLADPAGGIPIVGMKDIQDGRVRIDPEVRVTLTDEDAEPYLLKDGDILLNRTNSPDLVGKAGIYRGDGKAVFASYLVRLELDQTQVDPDFIIQILASEGGQRRIRQLATRAVSQANLNPTTFKNHFLIPIPALKEQVGIRDVLMAWDTAIETTERLIAAKERFHRWLQQRLIEQRAARHHWETQELGGLIRERSERSIQHDEYPVLTSSRRGLFLQSEYFSKQVTSEDNTGYKIMRRGDFTFRSMSDDGRFVFNRLEKYDTGIISPAYGVFYAEGVSPEFLAHYLNSSYFAQLLARETQGGTRKALRFSALAGMEVDLPKRTDQERIAAILDNSRREIGLLQTRLEMLRRQKRGLMQKLLTGEWRVPVREEATA